MRPSQRHFVEHVGLDGVCPEDPVITISFMPD
jgi:hypothetical protein